MFLTLAVALLAGVVLEAEGLKIWAERLELGALRTFSVPVTERWHEFAQGFGAEQPRRLALTLKADWADGLAPSSAAGVAEVAVRAAQPAPQAQTADPEAVASTPVATASAAQEASSPQPVLPGSAPLVLGVPASAPQIVLAGDSMMAVGLAPVLRRGLGVNVVKAYRSGTGLARPEVFDWLEQYPKMVAGANPVLVICALGANDGQNVQSGKNVLTFGTPEWDAFYRERLTAYLDLLTRNDHKVLWIGMPLMRSPAFAKKMKHMNALVQDVLKAYPQVSWLDPDPALGYDEAVFAQYKPDARGKMIKLRADDGIHMTDEGAAFLLPGIRTWMQHQLPQPERTVAVSATPGS
jgi:hypothetical protein